MDAGKLMELSLWRKRQKRAALLSGAGMGGGECASGRRRRASVRCGGWRNVQSALVGAMQQRGGARVAQGRHAAPGGAVGGVRCCWSAFGRHTRAVRPPAAAHKHAAVGRGCVVPAMRMPPNGDCACAREGKGWKRVAPACTRPRASRSCTQLRLRAYVRPRRSWSQTRIQEDISRVWVSGRDICASALCACSFRQCLTGDGTCGRACWPGLR